MRDILERLNDSYEYVDAIDDAIHEIEDLRELLKLAEPFVEDMIGIASSARGVNTAIKAYFLRIELLS